MWSTSLFWAHCSSRNDKGPLRPAIPVAVMASLAQGCILQILCWLSGEQSFRDSPLDSPWEHFWRELMPPSQVLEHVDHSVQFLDELAWNYKRIILWYYFHFIIIIKNIPLIVIVIFCWNLKAFKPSIESFRKHSNSSIR